MTNNKITMMTKYAALMIVVIISAAGCDQSETPAKQSQTPTKTPTKTPPPLTQETQTMSDSQIETGNKAPAFTMVDQNSEKHKLSDYLGQWVVLYFYPKADTPGCTIEACEFTEGIESFKNLSATVIGVSPDQPDKLKKFEEKYDLKITLLSDPDKKVMTKYGAWGEKNMYGKITVGTIRSTVLIDPQGKVAHHWKKVKAKGHAEFVQKKLEELQTK